MNPKLDSGYCLCERRAFLCSILFTDPHGSPEKLVHISIVCSVLYRLLHLVGSFPAITNLIARAFE